MPPSDLHPPDRVFTICTEQLTVVTCRGGIRVVAPAEE
jgi:hypothetical protein